MRFSLASFSVAAIVSFAPQTLADSASDQPFVSSSRSRAHTARAAPKTYSVPGRASWPTEAQWNAFNATVEGQLIKVTPWAAPCYKDPNSAECQIIKDTYLNPVVRAEQIGITQLDNWSTCTSLNIESDCTLNVNVNGVPFLPAKPVCGLGRIAPYAVKVTNAAVAQAAIKFAKQRNIQIVIKNTGHDYLGRSSGGSLTLWTRSLNSLTYYEDFQGKTAIAMGAGVLADAAYNFASSKGKSITLGAVGSVGVGGGFVLGGGHGPLGPSRGLAVDSVLQFTVVTADGVLRIANATSNQDLFWALRGGGGSFGLVLETVIEVYPDTPYTQLQYGISTRMSWDKDRTLIDFIAKLASFQEGWTEKGWAGYAFIYDDQILMSAAVPNGDRAAAEAQMNDMLNYARFTWGLITYGFAYTVHPNQNAYRKVVGVGADTITPVGYAQRLASRLIPRSAFAPDKRVKLAADIVAAYRATTPSVSSLQGMREYLRTGAPLQIYSTGPRPASMGGPDGLNTGVNPAWRDALWEVVVVTSWNNHAPAAAKKAIARAAHEAGDRLRGYGTGTYHNEADADEEDWKKAFFGSNYDRLLSIKQRIDPDHMFLNYKGVGWAGQESANSFKCYRSP